MYNRSVRKIIRTITILVLLLTFSVPGQAQENRMGETDSLRFYKDVEKFSKKRGITRFLYKLVLKPVAPPVSARKKKKIKKIAVQNFDLYNCKIIRNISIEVTDPFGYALLDTTKKPSGFIQKKGNQIHMKTRRFIVRNFLIFKPGQEFEAYLASESERLLRQSGLFRDVIIYPIPNPKLKDSVDVLVRVIDRWSISADAVITTSAFRLRLTDRNIGGFGHTLRNRFEFDETGFSGYSLRYDINRIGKTYMTARFLHEELNTTTRSSAASLVRPFFSPITKWSWGATVYDVKYPDALFINNTLSSVPEVNTRGIDAYLSRSILLNQRGASFEKNAKFTNLILSGRLIRREQIANDEDFTDSLDTYHNMRYYLGMAALSNISFEQENYIFRFGEVEDIPLGRFIGIVAGFDPVRLSQYSGIRAGFATYRNLHYYSLIGSYGKFFEADGSSRNAFNLRLVTFSPLIISGEWKFRQFLRSGYTTGINLPANRFLQLSSEPGLERVNDGPLLGLHRLTVALQTQAYAPWQLIGFRFAPVMYFNAGLISNSRSQLFKSSVYSSIGIGLLIRNDFLVNNTFQVSISIFPNLLKTPDWFRFNDINNTDFTLPSIQQDLPDFVPFN